MVTICTNCFEAQWLVYVPTALKRNGYYMNKVFRIAVVTTRTNCFEVQNLVYVSTT